MRAAGAGWVRVNFRLGRCFPDWASAATCTGRPATDAYDAVLARAEASGLRVVGLLSNESWHGGQADWTANSMEAAGGNGDNAYARGFAEGAAGPLARRYAGRVAAWEVWNEPNAWSHDHGNGHYSGATFLYPSNFAWLLARSHAQIKAADPAAQVIMGGFLSHDTLVSSSYGSGSPAAGGQPPGGTRPGGVIGRCGTGVPGSGDSGAGYLCATYRAGLSRAGWQMGAFPFDRVAQHFYLNLGSTTSAGRMAAFLDDLWSAVMAYEGQDTRTMLDVTEFGWQAQAATSDLQAQNLGLSCAALAAHPRVDRAFWFTVQDIPEVGQYFGLLQSDGAPKPALDSFRLCAA
jgi:hypothetical protein